MFETSAFRRLRSIGFGGLVAVVAGWPLAAFATDGVLEISQSGVLASGGFPITLSASGSYRLTSNLSVGGNADAIAVAADDVFIDLNGFTITGGSPCAAVPPPVGSGSGIVGTAKGTTVTNGTVRGFGAYGLSIGDEGRAANVRVRCAGVAGIRLGAEGRVEQSSVSRSAVGIETGSSALLVDNDITSNGGFGLSLGAGSALRGNMLVDNNGGNQNLQFEAPQGSFELGPNRCGAGLTCVAGTPCGNGVIQAGETCDDANSTSGDGCSASCQVESRFQCTGQPSVCMLVAVCGDGIVAPGEQCDGFNLGGASCLSMGFSGGSLSCVQCVLDTTNCFF